jgi:integrase
MRFRDLAESWLVANPTKTSSSIMRDRSILDKHVLPTLGSMAISQISPRDVQALVSSWMVENLAPRTVRRHFAVVRAIFAFASRDDLIGRSPCRNINLPRVLNAERQQLTSADVAGLVDAMTPRLAPMILLGAVLGLRWGEVAGLRVRAINSAQGTVAIREQVVVTPGGGAAIGPPKSRAGVRTLAMPDSLAKVLADHIELHHLGSEDLLFSTANGLPLVYSNWHHRHWRPACRKAGLERIGFHDLRRANATALVAGGVDVKTTQTRLGHADARLTLEVYAQATTDGDRRAAEVAANRFMPTHNRSGSARVVHADDELERLAG